MSGRSSDPGVVISLVVVGATTGLYLLTAQDGTASSSGLLGHGLGVVGFLLMLVAEFAYSWRKRRSGGPGPLRRWMEVHVFSGLVGFHLVLLHSAFQFAGLAGVTLLVAGIVTGTGILGKFVFAAPPRRAPDASAGPDGIDDGSGADRAHGRARRGLSWWWLIHVTGGAVLTVLGIVHALAALYYGGVLP